MCVGVILNYENLKFDNQVKYCRIHCFSFPTSPSPQRLQADVLAQRLTMTCNYLWRNHEILPLGWHEYQQMAKELKEIVAAFVLKNRIESTTYSTMVDQEWAGHSYSGKRLWRHCRYSASSDPPKPIARGFSAVPALWQAGWLAYGSVAWNHAFCGRIYSWKFLLLVCLLVNWLVEFFCSRITQYLWYIYIYYEYLCWDGMSLNI